MLEYISLTGSVLLCMLFINIIPYATHIYDLGHYVTKKVDNSMLPEAVMFLLIVLFLCFSNEYTRFCWSISYFYWFRACTMTLTILPAINRFKPIEYGGFFGGHNDYLPASGHLFLVDKLCQFLVPSFGWYIYVVDVYIFYYLIAMRRHYTIELVISVILAQYVF